MKNARHEEILRIISDNEIETQHDLISELEKAGFSATQATVSRDVRDLGLVKEAGFVGKTRYVVNRVGVGRDYNARLLTIFKESVTSHSQARNLVVIKTLPGLAPAASSAIDSMGVEGLVGTVAGDDTAFLALVDEKAAENFCREIDRLLK